MSEALKVCCEHLANSQHIIEEKNKEIARLTAEVERHRMTEVERVGVAWAAREAEEWADENDDAHDQTHGKRALMLRALLDRTAPKESSGG